MRRQLIRICVRVFGRRIFAGAQGKTRPTTEVCVLHKLGPGLVTGERGIKGCSMFNQSPLRPLSYPPIRGSRGDREEDAAAASLRLVSLADEEFRLRYK